MCSFSASGITLCVLRASVVLFGVSVVRHATCVTEKSESWVERSSHERLATTLLTLTTGIALTLAITLTVVWYRVSGWHERRSVDSLMMTMMMMSGVMMFVGRHACIDCFIRQHLSLRSHVRHTLLVATHHSTHTHTHLTALCPGLPG